MIAILASFLLASQPTLLTEADGLCQKYGAEVAKIPPPSTTPLVSSSLNAASVWFSIDLDQLYVPKGQTPLQILNSESLWQCLHDIGIEGVYLKQGPQHVPFTLAGKEWTGLASLAQKKQMTLIGDALGKSTPWGSDFDLALQNVGEYPSLYHLIEIDPSDWNLLPSVPSGSFWTNIPWLTLQTLSKKGYVPEQFSPYVKESAWNATAKVAGIDGKVRRWIYLKEGKERPVFSWLSPSFGAGRIAAGGALHALFELGQKILLVDGELPSFAKKTLSLWIRKIGGYSAEKGKGTLDSLKAIPEDLAFDTLTRPALLHALIAEDAEILRLTYRLFLQEGIEVKRLIHALQPFDAFACDWAEFLAHPKKTYPYWQEQLTGEILRQRLLREDLIRLKIPSETSLPVSTWPGYCALALGIQEAQKEKALIEKIHLFLAFAYAMQPGVFSLSASDLLGALPEKAASLDLLAVQPDTLYASIPIQLKNPLSFASQLKELLAVRLEKEIAQADLIDILPVQNGSTLLLLERLPKIRLPLVLALNFARHAVEENLDLLSLRNTNAIDLMTALNQDKVFESSQFSFSLPPLSGKIFFFQSKHYD